MKKALLVIDVQRYFINSITRDLPKKISEYVKKNRKNYDLIVFTNFINDSHSSVCLLLNWKQCMTSPEIDIVSELQPMLKYGIVISKNVYSVLKAPKVQSLLKKQRIKELHLCGIDTDCCILATAYDGFDQGYKIHLLQDLCMASSNINLHNAALLIFKRNLIAGRAYFGNRLTV